MIKIHGREVKNALAVLTRCTALKILKPRSDFPVDPLVPLSVIGFVGLVVAPTVGPPALFTRTFKLSGVGPSIKARFRQVFLTFIANLCIHGLKITSSSVQNADSRNRTEILRFSDGCMDHHCQIGKSGVFTCHFYYYHIR